MRYRYKFVEKRTTSATSQMILAMAKYGNHNHRIKYLSDADIKRFFESNRIRWDDLLQSSRNPGEPIPIVENLAGSTWVVSTGSGGKVAVVSNATTEKEQEISAVEGPGLLTLSSYLQLFENAVSNLNRSMENASFADFQSCLSNGIASIDAYIMHRAYLYNSNKPSKQLVDTKESRVSQDDKIDEWIPQMARGKKLNKSGVNWRSFKQLISMRDEMAIHLKKPAYTVSYIDLCGSLNHFREGIAGLLVDLHQVFNEKIPCMILRYAYLPEITLVELPD